MQDGHAQRSAEELKSSKGAPAPALANQRIPSATFPAAFSLKHLKTIRIPAQHNHGMCSEPSEYLKWFPGTHKGSIDLDEPNGKVEDYLLRHPEFIDEYIRKNSYKYLKHGCYKSDATTNDFLLDVVRSIFQDMVSMDIVIKKVMNFAKEVVGADRASLFLIDYATGELYSRLYDHDERDLRVALNDKDDTSQEIRFKMGKGIAGQVAQTGETMNIVDAYRDPRFNPAVDKQTGYKTNTILCMPIYIRGNILGVVQMVNKKNGTFTEDDMWAFEQFAVYCGLALHHAKLYDKIQKSEHKFKVALDVLAYHRTCGAEEFIAVRCGGPIHKPPPDLGSFDFSGLRLEDDRLIHLAVYMFTDLFGLARFDLDTLYRFMITVKKNYRKIPYHNWCHAFTVAHSMYCILKQTMPYKPLECLAMFVGCICHDLDHRGKTNRFLKETSNPLAIIYTSSILEHHHFNQTMMILQEDGLDIFSNLPSPEYKLILANMKHCILATDLTNHFSTRIELKQLLTKGKFSWDDPDHRLIAQAVTMTSCDLSGCAKPWDVHAEIVYVIFEEFYAEGDAQKLMGIKPAPMFDRHQASLLPATQVNFLSELALTCYDLLYLLLPETKQLLDRTKENLQRWKTIEKFGKKRGSSDSSKGDVPEFPVGGTKWWKTLRHANKRPSREK